MLLSHLTDIANKSVSMINLLSRNYLNSITKPKDSIFSIRLRDASTRGITSRQKGLTIPYENTVVMHFRQLVFSHVTLSSIVRICSRTYSTSRRIIGAISRLPKSHLLTKLVHHSLHSHSGKRSH